MILCYNKKTHPAKGIDMFKFLTRMTILIPLLVIAYIVVMWVTIGQPILGHFALMSVEAIGLAISTYGTNKWINSRPEYQDDRKRLVRYAWQGVVGFAVMLIVHGVLLIKQPQIELFLMPALVDGAVIVLACLVLAVQGSQGQRRDVNKEQNTRPIQLPKHKDAKRHP